MNLCSVSEQCDTHRGPFSFGLSYDVDCFVEIVRPFFDESVLESSLYCTFIDLDSQGNSIVHSYSQRLGSAHLAQTGCEDDSSFETLAKMLPSGGCKSLVGSLEDSLCSYEGFIGTQGILQGTYE